MKLSRSRYVVALLVFAVLLAGQGFGETGARKKKKSTTQSKSVVTRTKSTTVMNKQKLAVPTNEEVAAASTLLQVGISRLQESLDCNC